MALSYRLAREEDYPLLVQYRVECLWGLPKLEQKWRDPNWIYCVFQSEKYGDVGMACWVLEMNDPDMASRSNSIVYLSSLFIQKQYQGKGFGRAAMTLLERAAVERFHAKWITLDTAAYHGYVKDGYWIEDFKKPGRTIAWYEERGYVQFKDCAPDFPGHPLPDDPDRLLSAAFLRKDARLVQL